VSGVLVLTGIAREARALAAWLGLSPVLGRDWAHYRGGAVEVACVGLAAKRLESRVASCRDAALVISAGACGALSPGLREGALVVPEVVLTPTGDRYETSRVAALTRHGALLSVAEVVGSPAEKARLLLETGAIAVDMESAAILEWARAGGRAALVVRAVSDTADQTVDADLAGLVDSEGRLRPLTAVRVAVARPRALRGAMALRTSMDAALRAVAAAVGQVARSAATMV